MSNKRSQAILVDRFLDWRKVEKRRRKYPHIAETFPMEVLEAANNRDSAYAVHYMAWMLGVWVGEDHFRRLDELLGIASTIAGWEKERKSLVRSAEYKVHFSLLWQLQVAEFMVAQRWQAEWQPEGPDLRCRKDDETLFVECYQPKSQHGVELFIEDVLASVEASLPEALRSNGNAIEVEHDLFRPLEFSEDNESRLIDQALRPFVDRQALQERIEAAQRGYTDVMFKEGRLRITLPGGRKTIEERLANAQLDPVEPIRCMLQKAIDSKADKNSLGEHRPNLVAVNTLLIDASLEGAFERRIGFAGYPRFELPDTIDAVAYSAAGINRELAGARFELATPAPKGHPAHDLGLRWAGERYRS